MSQELMLPIKKSIRQLKKQIFSLTFHFIKNFSVLARNHFELRNKLNFIVNHLEVKPFIIQKAPNERSTKVKKFLYTTHSCKFYIKQRKLKLLISPYRDVVQAKYEQERKRAQKKLFT